MLIISQFPLLPVTYANAVQRDAATYVHRVGRTGRFGTRGVAVCMVTSEELQQLRDYLSEAAAGELLHTFANT